MWTTEHCTHKVWRHLSLVHVLQDRSIPNCTSYKIMITNAAGWQHPQPHPNMGS